MSQWFFVSLLCCPNLWTPNADRSGGTTRRSSKVRILARDDTTNNWIQALGFTATEKCCIEADFWFLYDRRVKIIGSTRKDLLFLINSLPVCVWLGQSMLVGRRRTSLRADLANPKSVDYAACLRRREFWRLLWFDLIINWFQGSGLCAWKWFEKSGVWVGSRPKLWARKISLDCPEHGVNSPGQNINHSVQLVI